MTHLLHPFSRAHRGGECSSFEGVYNFTPRMAHRGERHSHDHYELYIHLRGGELFSIGSELAPMEPNQLVVIPPYCMHGLIYDEPLTDYERMYLNVTPETLTAAGGGLIDLPGLLEKAVRSGSYFYTLTEADAQRCKQCILRIREASAQAEGLGPFDAYLAMLEYLQIVAHAVESAAIPEKRAAAYPLIQQVMNYIDEHFTEPISLQAVADAFHISVSYLCHEFSRYNRHSIYDYVLYRRVITACAMIRRGESLTEIAYRCGFGNYNSFLRAFHKFIGVPPREYVRR